MLRRIGFAVLLISLFVVGSQDALAQRSNKVRVTGPNCKAQTTQQDGVNYLHIQCGNICHRTRYGLTTPAPSVNSGVDGLGNPFMEVQAAQGYDIYRGNPDECYDDSMLECSGSGMDLRCDCSAPDEHPGSTCDTDEEIACDSGGCQSSTYNLQATC